MLPPYLSKEIHAYTKRENVELLGGQGGLALYFLSQWVKTGQSRSLLQAQLCLKKALLGINKLYEETIQKQCAFKINFSYFFMHYICTFCFYYFQ